MPHSPQGKHLQHQWCAQSHLDVGPAALYILLLVALSPNKEAQDLVPLAL